MSKIYMHEAYSNLKSWIYQRFISKSVVLQPFLQMTDRLKFGFSSNHHFTPIKVFKFTIGLIPVSYLSYYLAYEMSNKTPIDEIISYFKSEDEIFSLVSKKRPVVTFMYLPGEVYSEVTHPAFHSIADEFHKDISFIKVNCSKNSAFCRSRKLKQFPTLEIYIPPPADDASFETKTRYRLLKSSGDYAISPFKSDFSYVGIKSALQELKLVPSLDTFKSARNFYQSQFESYYK